MKDAQLNSFIKNERQRFISYVRSLLLETAAADAEDIVHDVLVKILEKADLIVPEDNLMAYVYRSLKNRVIDTLRTGKPTVSLDDGSSEEDGRLVNMLKDLQPNALEILQTREGNEQLFAALEVLSAMERQVIIAYELEGIPFRELARQWEVPQNTLLSHKSRAMKRLKRYFLDARGGTL